MNPISAKKCEKRQRPYEVMPSVLISAVVALCFMGYVDFACAQDAGDSAVEIGSVEVRGLYVVPRSKVLRRLDLEPGDSIRESTLRKRIQKVNQWGGFGKLSMEMDEGAQEPVQVRIKVEEKVVADEVHFVGNERISSKRLRTIGGIEKGSKVTPSRTRSAERSITDAYKKVQRPLASVSATARFRGDSPRAIIQFGIVEGPKTYVRKIVFRGNTAFDDSGLLDVMETGERGWPPFIWSGSFDQRTFFQDVKRVENKYYQHGYLDAIASGYWTYLPDFSGLVLHISVFEGRRYQIGKISFSGNSIFTDHELREAIPLRESKVFRPAQMDKSIDIIAERYGEQGYVQVDQDPGALQERLAFEPGGEEGMVDVRIEIEEGVPAYIRRIRVEGLTRSDELLVLRNLTIKPGDRVDTEEFKRSESRLLDTGYFNTGSRNPVNIRVASETEETEEEDLPGLPIPTESELRDTIVEVKEGQTGKMMFGAGVSSEDGLLGQFSVTESNFDIANTPKSWRDFFHGNAFRGGGQKLTLRAALGTESSTFLVSFANPSVNHSNIGYNARIYRHSRAWEEFDLTKTGFAAGLTRSQGNIVKQSLEVGLESIDMSDLDDDAPPEIRRDDDTFIKPYIEAVVSRDTRDSTRFPTTGYLAQLRGEVGFADIEILKLVGDASQYWTIVDPENSGPHVLRLRGRIGVMDSWSGDRIPVFERFYAGGMHSLRGFETWGVAPVEPVDDEQVGGESMLTGSLEYTLPVLMEDFRLAGFIDAGYVEEKAEDVFTGWDKLRMSPGVGIRWNIPAMGGIPIRVDVAVPVMDEEHDDTRSVHFSFGAGYRF